MPTLHVHLDESGNLSFTPNGTKHFIFAAAWTYDPRPLADELTALRFRLLKSGVDVHTFHAAEDQQRNRDAVVGGFGKSDYLTVCGICPPLLRLTRRSDMPELLTLLSSLLVLLFVLGYLVALFLIALRKRQSPVSQDKPNRIEDLGEIEELERRLR